MPGTVSSTHHKGGEDAQGKHEQHDTRDALQPRQRACEANIIHAIKHVGIGLETRQLCREMILYYLSHSAAP